MNFRQPRRCDEGHLAWVRQLPCAICGNDIETEAAHIKFACVEIAKPMSGGTKPDDKYTVPLCGRHHRAQHDFGDERGWWHHAGRDPIKLSLALYSVSGDLQAGERIIRSAH